jgi:hypothetical protein
LEERTEKLEEEMGISTAGTTGIYVRVKHKGRSFE